MGWNLRCMLTVAPFCLILHWRSRPLCCHLLTQHCSGLTERCWVIILLVKLQCCHAMMLIHDFVGPQIHSALFSCPVMNRTGLKISVNSGNLTSTAPFLYRTHCLCRVPSSCQTKKGNLGLRTNQGFFPCGTMVGSDWFQSSAVINHYY